MSTSKGTVVLGVAASDAHAVANHLIAYSLRAAGYDVVNLGTCTPVSEFAEAAGPDTLAVIIGSLNGHVHEDLHDLREAEIPCPVIVGGNLSVGSQKDASSLDRLYALGVDHILSRPDQLPALLERIAAERSLEAIPVAVAAS